MFLLLLTKVKIQINQLKKDSLGKSNEIALVSELAILAQKLSKIAAEKKKEKINKKKN